MNTDTSELVQLTAGPARTRVPDWWPLVVGLLALAIPTIASLASEAWSTDTGAHGPIVLSTGLWLLYHNGLRPAAPERQGRWLPVTPVLALALATYAAARAFDFASLEYLGLYGVFLAMVYRLCGGAAIRQQAFPLFYLLLAVPPPGSVMAAITAPLQTLVSWAAEHASRFVGLPVSREGVVLFVGPYQLLVEDACAGLNSMFGLISVSLLYIYLAHRASWRHAALLLAALVPIAILANILRILGLILICYNFGDAAAQGFMHSTTGLILFVVGLVMVMLVDRFLVSPLFRKAK